MRTQAGTTTIVLIIVASLLLGATSATAQGATAAGQVVGADTTFFGALTVRLLPGQTLQARDSVLIRRGELVMAKGIVISATSTTACVLPRDGQARAGDSVLFVRRSSLQTPTALPPSVDPATLARTRTPSEERPHDVYSPPAGGSGGWYGGYGAYGYGPTAPVQPSGNNRVLTSGGQILANPNLPRAAGMPAPITPAGATWIR